MEMRTSCPDGYNKYYMTSDCGGYSWAIKGKPTKADANVLSNCVGYANGRFAEIMNKGYIPYQLVCNAENFIEKAKAYGLQITDYPTLGGIMVFEGLGDLAGHVMINEKLLSANSVYTSESSWGGTAFFNATRYNTNGRWGMSSNYRFIGNIVNPAIGDVHWVDPQPTPTPTPDDFKVGDKVLVTGVATEDSYGGGHQTAPYTGNPDDPDDIRYITLINPGAPRPYHISVGDALGDGDRGWVSADQLKKI